MKYQASTMVQSQINAIAQDMSEIFPPKSLEEYKKVEGGVDYLFGSGLRDSRPILKGSYSSLNNLFSKWIQGIVTGMGISVIDNIIENCRALFIKNLSFLSNDPHLKGTITYLVIERLHNSKTKPSDIQEFSENILDEQITELIQILSIRDDITVPDKVQQILKQKPGWIKDEQIYKRAIEEFTNTNKYDSEVKLLDADNITYSIPVIKCLVLTESAQAFKERLQNPAVCEFISQFKDGIDRNVLHYAIWKGRADIIDTLCDNFPQLIEGEDRYKRTPLNTACDRGSNQIVEKLCAYNAKFISDGAGRTPLHLATRSNTDSVEKIETLIRAFQGLDIINLRDSYDNRTSMHFAARYNSVDALKKLVSLGAKVDEKDKDEHTPAHLAASWDNLEALKVLQSFGAKLGEYDINGLSPIHLAARWSSIKTLEFLCNSPEIGIHYKDKTHGATPLHTAVFYWSPDSVKTLLHIKADPNLKDSNDRSVLKYITDTKYPPTEIFNTEKRVNVISQFIDHGYKLCSLEDAQKKAYIPPPLRGKQDDVRNTIKEGTVFLNAIGIDENTTKNGTTVTYLGLKKAFNEARAFNIDRAHGVFVGDAIKNPFIKIISDFLDATDISIIILDLLKHPSSLQDNAELVTFHPGIPTDSSTSTSSSSGSSSSSSSSHNSLQSSLLKNPATLQDNAELVTFHIATEKLIGKALYDHLMPHVKAGNWKLIYQILNTRDITNVETITIRDILVAALGSDSKESESLFSEIIHSLSQDHSKFKKIIHGVLIQVVKEENIAGFNKLKNNDITKGIVHDIINIPEEGSKLTALHIACDNHDSQMLESILSIKGVDIDVRSSLDRTPMQIAAWREGQSERGDFSIIEILLNKYIEKELKIFAQDKEYIENSLNSGSPNLILDFNKFCDQHNELLGDVNDVRDA